MRSVVVGHTAFTVAMFGLMWAVQIVVYPQFRSVAPAEFATYAADHGARITTALALLAPAEIVFAGWLFLDTPAGLSRSAVFISGALLAAGWIATAFFFAPLHGKFQGPYDRDLIEQLISTNWLHRIVERTGRDGELVSVAASRRRHINLAHLGGLTMGERR